MAVVTNGIVLQLDADAQKMMESLRKDKILRSSMDVRNISFFRIKWSDVENRNPSDDPDYLRRFCDAFCTKVGKLLENRDKTARIYWENGVQGSLSAMKDCVWNCFVQKVRF